MALTLVRDWKQHLLETDGLKKLVGPFQAVNALLRVEAEVTRDPGGLPVPLKTLRPPWPSRSGVPGLSAAAIPGQAEPLKPSEGLSSQRAGDREKSTPGQAEEPKDNVRRECQRWGRPAV